MGEYYIIHRERAGLADTAVRLLSFGLLGIERQTIINQPDIRQGEQLHDYVYRTGKSVAKGQRHQIVFGRTHTQNSKL